MISEGGPFTQMVGELVKAKVQEAWDRPIYGIQTAREMYKKKEEHILRKYGSGRAEGVDDGCF